MRESARSRKVTRSLLSRTPLPEPGADSDKDARGRVLVIGGEATLPGAVLLAGIAALRAGAGKLQLASCASIATHIGVAVPESLSISLRETKSGTIHPGEAKALREFIVRANALLIGPGMKAGRNNLQLVQSLLEIETKAGLVLDAGALEILSSSPGALHGRDGNAVITPHHAEMSMINGVDEASVALNAHDVALDAAAALGAVVALKGSTTHVASPDGRIFRYESGDVGLATSGSGDTLAGLVAGLLARGADPFTATLWAVYLHGEAGNVLARRMGRIGYLARELLDEIPPLLRR